jgi:hypothetical protein
MRTFLTLVAGGLLIFAAGGCYNPQIADGKLGCSQAGECPDGFECRSGKCFKTGSTIGPDSGGQTDSGGQGDGGQMMCVEDFYASCAQMNRGVCDPVCQKGCGCNQQCQYDQTGSGTLCQTLTTRSFRLPYQTCNPDPKATAGVICRPGSLCLNEARLECGAHCYRYCRSDSDCDLGDLKARCSGLINLTGSNDPQSAAPFKVCSPPLTDCVPVGPRARTSCRGRGEAWGCYILSLREHTEDTVCDCAGTIPVDQECERERDCEPGAECLKIGDEVKCRRLCQLTGVLPGVGECPAGQTCKSLSVANVSTPPTKYGVCTPDL